MPIYALDDHHPELPEAGQYWVAPDAHVMGRVRLAALVGIWFGAVLRGDNELIDIAARAAIYRKAPCCTPIWAFPPRSARTSPSGITPSCMAAVVGAGSLIGMGATILNGAQIGAGCLVGANALVTEGKVFADGSLIMGSPAKAVRELDGAARDKLVQSARSYVANWRRFNAGLRRIG